MQNFLNLTLPLKQDPISQAGVKQLVEKLNESGSPHQKRIEDVLKNSNIVHFARFLLIDTQYLQVITTFDGDEDAYAKFFFEELNPLFKEVYELVEGAPTGRDFTVENFREFNKKIQETQVKRFFWYSAYPDKTVREIVGL